MVFERDREAEFYRSLLEDARDAIYRLNIETGRFDYISPSCETVAGYSPAEIMAMDVKSMLEMVHPEDRAVLVAAARNVERSGKAEAEYRQRTKSGEYRWMSNQMALANAVEGGPAYRFGNIRDITEGKRSEEALRESEERFRTLTANLSSAVALIDEDGKFTLYNPAFLRMFGLDRNGSIKNVNDQNWGEWQIFGRDAALLDVDDHPVRKAVLTGQPVRNSLVGVRNPGESKLTWMLITAEPIQKSDGRRQTICTYHDITESVRAEEALRESEARYKSLFNSMTEGFSVQEIITDEAGKPIDWRFLDINPAFERLTGLKREDVLGKTHNELLPGDDPRWLEIYGRVALTGEPAQFEDYSSVLDRHFEVFAYSPQHRQFAVIFMDVSARKRTERELHEANERLAALMQALPVGVSFSNDPSCSHVTGNPAALAQFGVTPEDNFSASAPEPDAPGRKVRYFAEGKEIPAADLPLQRAVNENREIPLMELEVECADGRRWVAQASGAPVRSADGSVISGVVVTMDITDRKHTEERLKHYAAERETLLEAEMTARTAAERATRVKDDFLATLSHELRTPLNAVLGWASLLRKRPFDLEKGLGIIERNARAQSQLIEDLLDMNRIFSGRFEIAKEEVSLTQIIDEALAALERMADEKKIMLDSDIQDLANALYADGARLKQVFWNLLTNALKFTPEGGTIKVSLRQERQNAVIEVSDTGEGIDPAFISRIFGRFTQEGESISRRKGGLGLGLAISKHIVEMHGGTLKVKSDGKGLGSTFTVTLPLYEIQRSHLVRAETSAPLQLPEGISILVVEDEADSLEFLRRLLEEHGARVDAVSSALIALEKLDHERPDIIVSDISMPDMDGYTFIRTLRSLSGERSQIPAIAVTAFARKEDEAKAFEAGFSAHISKPLNPSELLRTIAALERRQAPEGQAETFVM